MADETLTLPCSRSIILPIDGGDLVEPAVETASIRNAETYVYPDDFPYKMVVDFSILVNKSRRWTSTTTTSSSSSSDIPDDGGLIEESTARASFSMPFYTVLFTSAVGGDFYLGRLRRHIEITKVVPPEYCTFVAEGLCATASPFIQEMVNSMRKLKSFKVKVEVDSTRTIEYTHLQNRGRKRKGLLD